jgi:peptidyl-prolyl cis-trans isomerase-like 4
MGMVSTANKGPNLNNSDFFITLSKENLVNLNTKHTIFGKVQEGLDILEKMNDIHVDDHYRPLINIRIKHTVVLDDPFEDTGYYI